VVDRYTYSNYGKSGDEGKPVHHANPKKGKPHYHPTDAMGKIIKNGKHFTYGVAGAAAVGCAVTSQCLHTPSDTPQPND
jgi:hypothetical protein